MKKALILTVLGGLVSAVSTQAQVNIHLAGSTAFRANVYRAVYNAFDGGAPTAKFPSSISGSTGTYTVQGTISNVFGTNLVTVYALFDGSVRGLADINNGVNLNYLTLSGGTNAATPDFTMCDVDKVSTLFPQAPTLEIPVAVIPFVYVRSYSAPTNFVNVTGHQLKNLFASANGYLSTSYFTSNTNDDTSSTPYVYVTGRNKDSGTRVTGDADSYAGATSPTFWGTNTAGSVNQWAVMNQYLSPAPSGKPSSFYGYGFASGGNEAGALAFANTSITNNLGFVTNAILSTNNSIVTTNYTTNSVFSTNLVAAVGYLGLSDALAAVGTASSTGVTGAKGNCAVLTYDGAYPFLGYTNTTSTNVPANPDFTPIKNGQYSLWSYENVEISNSHTNTTDAVYQYVTNMISLIDSDIANAQTALGNNSTYGGAVTAVRLSDMKVGDASYKK